ncbi:MAG: hypothetical protein CMJ47_12200 [Planctomyces sp.]|nr:hypothetical protein [Planctomyces sp.]
MLLNVEVTCAAMVLLFAAVGCGGGDSGPQTYPVSGQVTYAGKPVASGRIAFLPPADAGGPSYAFELNEGRYTGEVSAGQKRVEIYGTFETGEMESDDTGEKQIPVLETLPDKYNQSSELEATISEGSNEDVNFELE